jgi:hypothetical protein
MRQWWIYYIQTRKVYLTHTREPILERDPTHVKSMEKTLGSNHTSVEEYEFNHNRKTYRHDLSLKKHQRYHIREKPYGCN